MKTYQVKCKKGHTAIFDKGDYSDFCMCGEKYERTIDHPRFPLTRGD